MYTRILSTVATPLARLQRLNLRFPSETLRKATHAQCLCFEDRFERRQVDRCHLQRESHLTVWRFIHAFSISTAANSPAPNSRMRHHDAASMAAVPNNFWNSGA